MSDKRPEPTGICELCGHAQYAGYLSHTMLCVRFQELQKKVEELTQKLQDHITTLGNHG
jgi:hypothetical protein